MATVRKMRGNNRIFTAGTPSNSGERTLPKMLPSQNINREENPECGKFLAGGTRWRVKQWLNITHDPWVLEAIKGVKVEFLEVPEQIEEPEPYRMSVGKQDYIDREIELLLGKGILESCEECRGQFVSNVFLKPKPNGKFQMILYLKDRWSINILKWIPYKQFWTLSPRLIWRR